MDDEIKNINKLIIKMEKQIKKLDFCIRVLGVAIIAIALNIILK